MISFVTAVKLMPGYEDYQKRLEMYVECIAAHCVCEYEILVVEDQNAANLRLLRACFPAEWWAAKKARLIEYEAVYPNPHGYNMIESFAKNVGIREAVHPYVCVTNADVFFDTLFFENLKRLKPKTFYRFKQYEVAVPTDWCWKCVEQSMSSAKWENPQVLNGTIQGIAYKSGDVMLMHRNEWRRIRGYPENEVWVHSDLVVCVVVSNNGIAVEIPDAGVYTYAQTRERKEQPHEMQTALLYETSLVTNLLPFE